MMKRTRCKLLILLAFLVSAALGCNDQQIELGSKEADAGKGIGESCAEDAECESKICSNEKCTPSSTLGGKKLNGEDCQESSECRSGNCDNQKCAPNSSGTSCTLNKECGSGSCIAHKCDPNTSPKECVNDDACIGACINLKCEESVPKRKKCESSKECEGGLCSNRYCIPDPNDPQLCEKNQLQCNPGFVCKGNRCVLDPEKCKNPCGDVCCGDGKSCFLGQCEPNCGDGRRRCGTSGAGTCCQAGEGCVGNECVPLGSSCNNTTSFCPITQYCDEEYASCIKYTDNNELCTYSVRDNIKGKLKLHWNGKSTNVDPKSDQVMVTPMVADIDGDGLPDIVFSTFPGRDYLGAGVLRAIKGQLKPGTESMEERVQTIWDSSSTTKLDRFWVNAVASVAIGEIDGEPGLEVVSSLYPVRGQTQVIAVDGKTGNLKWRSPAIPFNPLYDWGNSASIANIDHSGTPEVLFGRYVLSGADGSILCTLLESNYTPFAFDVIEGGNLEIIAGGLVYEVESKPDGTFTCNILPPEEGNPSSIPPINPQRRWAFSAVADMIPSSKGPQFEGPEIVTSAAYGQKIELADRRGKIIDTWMIENQDRGRNPDQGGPPTLADFNGDGRLQIGVATKRYYYVLRINDQNKLELDWKQPIAEKSSGVTGSSVFDFNGDGKAEVAYCDEKKLHIFDGKNGTNYWSADLGSGTGTENPIVVDIDRDGHSDIVVGINNFYSGGFWWLKPIGIYVYADEKNQWVDTRGIWNQHAYHVVNVNPDGTIPVNQPAGWKEPWSNNFRQNVQKGNGLLAPNLTVKFGKVFDGACSAANNKPIEFTVFNTGSKTLFKNSVDIVIQAAAENSNNFETIETVRNKTDIVPNGQESFNVTGSLPASLREVENIKLKAIVDPNAEVPECFENDNEAKISVGGQFPNLIPTIVSVDAANCFTKGITVSYEIVNRGSVAVAANQVKVKIYGKIGDEDYKLLDSQTLNVEIPANGQTGRLDYTWDTSTLTNIPLKVKIVVDEDGAVNECRDDDNEVVSDSLFCALYG